MPNLPRRNIRGQFETSTRSCGTISVLPVSTRQQSSRSTIAGLCKRNTLDLSLLVSDKSIDVGLKPLCNAKFQQF
jgi:hypothetical protein